MRRMDFRENVSASRGRGFRDEWELGRGWVRSRRGRFGFSYATDSASDYGKLLVIHMYY